MALKADADPCEAFCGSVEGCLCLLRLERTVRTVQTVHKPSPTMLPFPHAPRSSDSQHFSHVTCTYFNPRHLQLPIFGEVRSRVCRGFATFHRLEPARLREKWVLRSPISWQGRCRTSRDSLRKFTSAKDARTDLPLPPRPDSSTTRRNYMRKPLDLHVKARPLEIMRRKLQRIRSTFL